MSDAGESADREDLTPADTKALKRLVTMERTDLGCEIETALGEVLAHVRGETGLSCRIVDDPAASRIVALRKRLRLSRQKFADRFGLDVSKRVQRWTESRTRPAPWWCRRPARLGTVQVLPAASHKAAHARGWPPEPSGGPAPARIGLGR